MQQRTGTAATMSIVFAIGSYFATFTGHPILALLAAVASVPLGVLGLIMAASPRVSGGILSIVAIALGSLGFVVALLGAVGMLIL
jgi:hypothetical protein